MNQLHDAPAAKNHLGKKAFEFHSRISECIGSRFMSGGFEVIALAYDQFSILLVWVYICPYLRGCYAPMLQDGKDPPHDRQLSPLPASLSGKVGTVALV